MNKKEFIHQLSDRLSIPQKDCRLVINTSLELLADELREGTSVLFQGFGSFDPWEQVERPGRNPRTLEPCPIPSRTSVKFKPGKKLLKRLNKK